MTQSAEQILTAINEAHEDMMTYGSGFVRVADGIISYIPLSSVYRTISRATPDWIEYVADRARVDQEAYDKWAAHFAKHVTGKDGS